MALYTFSDRILIVRKNHVSIYGRVINIHNKLGNYEVVSDTYHQGYADYSDAEKMMQYLAGKKE